MKWFKQKKIVVPFDFSDASVSAVEVARQLCDSLSEVHVIHVIPNLVATEPGVIWDTIDDASRMEHAREELKNRLAEQGVDQMQINVGIGDPGRVVCDLADEIDAGLIVIPSHGRTGLARFVLGSVAERVVRHAKCPVLVLKSDSDEKE